MAAERTAPPPTTVSSASAAAATSAPSSSPSIDLVFSLQLDHKLVTSIRAGTATTRAHQLASSVAGSPAVGGVPNGAELVLVLYRREVFVDGRGQRRSAGADAMAAGAVAEEQTATSSLCTATLKDGFLPTDQWLWVELGRTEVTEMRDSTHAAFIVPLAVTPLHSKTSGSDLRVEVHYLHEGSAVVTRPVAFVEFTEEQLLSGTRRRQSSGVVASSVDRSASETTEPLASVPKGTPRTRPDRPPSPIYDTRAGLEKTMSCSLFAVGNGTIFEGGAIVGELVVQMAEPPFIGHASALPFVSTANSTYTQRYNVPSTSHHTLQISEQLAESPYAVLTPLALLHAFSAEQQSILNELDDMAAAMVPGHPQSVNKDLLGRVRCSCGGKCRLPDDMNVIRLRQVQAHRALLEHYDEVQRGIVQRLKNDENGQPTWLRRSTEKKGTDSQWIALNCCVHEMVAEDVIAGEALINGVTTFGAPAAHAFGFKSTMQPVNTTTDSFFDPLFSYDDKLATDTTVQSILRHHATTGLAQIRAKLDEYERSFHEFETQVRTSAERWVTARTAVSKVCHETVQSIVWLINDTLAYSKNFSTINASMGQSASSGSGFFRRAPRGCGGLPQLDLQTEVLRLRDHLLQKYLPEFTIAYRELCSLMAEVASREEHEYRRSLAKLRDEPPSLTIGKSLADALPALEELMADGVTTLANALKRVSFTFDRLVVKSVALLEQQTILADYFAINGGSGNGIPALLGGGGEDILAGRPRRDAILSQAIGGIVSGFQWAVQRWFRMRRRNSESTDADVGAIAQKLEDDLFWETLLRVGFLAQFESLLSSQGDERGMLDDMRSALDDVREHVSLGVHCLREGMSLDDAIAADMDRDANSHIVFAYGPRSVLVVSVGVVKAIYDTVPAELRKRRSTIALHPVLFSQGINEQQLMANIAGDTILQDRVNDSGLHVLEEFIQRWRAFMKTKSIDAPEQGLDLTLQDGRRIRVQYRYPSDLVNAVDDLLFEIRAFVIGGAATSRDEEPTLAGSTSAGTSFAPIIGSSIVSSTRSLFGLSTSLPPTVKPKKSRIRSQSTLLMLVSHLTRLLTQTNPQSSLNGSTADYVFSRMPFQAKEVSTRHIVPTAQQWSGATVDAHPLVIQLSPTTPCAGRYTCCKSAKDRTSVAVTLEQVMALRYRGSPPVGSDAASSTTDPARFSTTYDYRVLAGAESIEERRRRTSHASVASSASLPSLNTRISNVNGAPLPVLHHDFFVRLLTAMRSEVGVRLANVERNLELGWGATGYRKKALALPVIIGEDEWHHAVVGVPRRGSTGKFAFNSLQWVVLPMLYRPPMRCIGGGLLT